MDFSTHSSKIIVTCNKRVSVFLQEEIEQLGFNIIKSFSTGIEIRGTLNDCVVLNLNLGCASQVLFSLLHFECNSPAQLYEAAYGIAWENILSINSYFSVTGNIDHPSIRNSLFANVKLKDAIVDKFRKSVNARPDSGPELQNVVIHLFWKEQQAEIFIDASGETIAKHGYRKIPGKAPMMEALAAATLRAIKWNKNTTFINPMCGSGTIVIEAALLATSRKPGLFRNNYGFMHICGFDRDFYEKVEQNLAEQIINLAGIRIIATDISEDAINISKINAAAAGVKNLIEFDICDFEKTKIPQNSTGIIYFNPEYGERLGNIKELEETYKRIGNFMKQKCKGYTGYVFTGNLELAKKIGLKATRKIEFYNAKIDCRLLEYDLYEGTKRVREY